jgi:hypothetical protein
LNFLKQNVGIFDYPLMIYSCSIQPAAGVTCMLIGDSAIGHRRSIDGGTTARSFNQLAHFTGRQRASTHGDFRRRQQIDFPAYSSIASWHGSESSSQTAAPVS